MFRDPLPVLCLNFEFRKLARGCTEIFSFAACVPFVLPRFVCLFVAVSMVMGMGLHDYGMQDLMIGQPLL